MTETFHVKGKCSWFGGPEDTGVSPSEGLAWIYDLDDAPSPELFLSYQPEGTSGLARRLNPDSFYVACRFYPEGDADAKAAMRPILLEEMALVRNPKNGKQVKCWASDWGPHDEKTGGRVADLSPAALEYLGLTTDQECEVVFPFTHRAPAVVAKPYPRIRMSSGHSTLCQGAVGILNEVECATAVVDRTAQLLIDRGVDCQTFHDTTSKDQNTNLHKITDWTNSKPHDLAVSVHLNANVETSSPMGTECLWVTQEALAKKIADAIASCGFKNRGPKYRSDLWFLNQTIEKSVLLEICFVDSSADASLYKETFEEICESIATVLGGEAKAKPEPKIARQK